MSMMTEFSSDKINVGDEVAVTYSNTDKIRKVSTVKRITPKGFVVIDDGTRFKKDGREHSKNFHCKLLLLTPEIKQMIEQQNYRAKLNMFITSVSDVEWRRLPTDKLERVIAILTDTTSSTDSD